MAMVQQKTRPSNKTTGHGPVIGINKGGVMTLSSKLRDPKVTDLTEEELGIFEDDADCADLTESEGEGDHEDYKEEARDTIQGAPQPCPKSYISNSTNTTGNTGLTTTTKNIIDVQLTHGLRTDLTPGFRSQQSDVSDAAHTIYSGKRNTPANMFNDLSFDDRRSQLVPSSDSMFRKAMTLMTERCTSVSIDPNQNDGRQTPLVSYKQQPLGQAEPKMFYVHQHKPVPMPPLKAWRGYNGNVYFEPIQVNPAPCNEESLDLVAAAHNAVYNRQQSRMSEKSNDKSVGRGGPSVQSMAPTGSEGEVKVNKEGLRSKSTLSMAGSVKSQVSNRQMSILDKKTVFSSPGEFLEEDVTWIIGQENTGSLRVTTGPKKQHNVRHKMIQPQIDRHAKTGSNDKGSRVFKGSVAHQIYSKKQQYPLLSVRGGKYFYNPKDKHTMYRSQQKLTTPANTHRAGLTTPDPNFRPDYRLPPLEQVSITGRMKAESFKGHHQTGPHGSLSPLKRPPNHEKTYIDLHSATRQAVK